MATKLKMIVFGVSVTQGAVDEGETEGAVNAFSKLPATLWPEVKPLLNMKGATVKAHKLLTKPGDKQTVSQGLWAMLHPKGARYIELVYEDGTAKRFTEPRGKYSVED